VKRSRLRKLKKRMKQLRKRSLQRLNGKKPRKKERS